MTFLDDLAKAERPAILVGGGAYKARESIVAAAAARDIPCFRTWNAQDTVTDDAIGNVYCGTIGTYGGPGRNFGIQNCDLLLSLGCRMSGRITGGMPETFARGAKKYIIDIDMEVLKSACEQVKGDGVVIQSDVGKFVNDTFNYQFVTRHFTPWLNQCIEWRKKYDPVRPEMMEGYDLHHYGFMRRLSELLPSNAVIVSDTGGNVIMMGHCFRSKRGQRIFTSNGNTPMNFAMCGAIGAWFADPSRPIICVIGDGGMQGNLQELQTIKHYGIPLKVFIVNNLCLGNTRAYQVQNGMKEVASGPDGYSVPDFTKIVAAYGLMPFSIPARHMIDQVVNMMLSLDEPCICDVQHPNFFDYQPRMTLWNAALEEAFPLLPEEEFEANMIVPPLEGWRERRKQYRSMPDV